MTIAASWPWNLSTVPTLAPPGLRFAARQVPSVRSNGPRRGQAFGEAGYLGVVGGDDQDVFARHWRGLALLVDPLGGGLGEAGDQGGDGFDLFLRRVAVAFVGDFEEVEAAAVEVAGVREDLVLEAWLGGEEAFVEEVGGEGGDAWRQAPGDGEEDAAVFGHGEVIAEHVAEGRGVDAFGMGAFLRLFELLRVAQEDDAGRGVGGGEDVGEGHLGGFVDEEDVDGVRELFARPHPHRAADHVGGAGLQGAGARLRCWGGA